MTQTHLEGTMEGWWAPNSLTSTAIGAHWLTFLALLGCTVFLAYESISARGPSGREKFFAGYHEQYNIAFYVNLMASISYYGKVVSDTHGHNFENVGPFIIGLGNYKYADYMLTCPLLVMDLLYQLRAPYKVTGAVLIFAVLFIGAVTNFYPGDEHRPAALAWFGLGLFYYTLTYFFLLGIVKRQYKRLEEMAHGTEAKKALGPLKLAIFVFFSIWIAFPVIWVVSDKGFKIIDPSTAEILHCVADLIAKSLYGFALARFRRYYDKKMFEILESLGYNGEEAIEDLENEMRHMDKEKEMEKQIDKEERHHHHHIATRNMVHSTMKYSDDDHHVDFGAPRLKHHSSFELPERTGIPHSPYGPKAAAWIDGHVGHVHEGRGLHREHSYDDEVFHNSPRGPRLSPRKEYSRDFHREHPFGHSSRRMSGEFSRDEYSAHSPVTVRNPASRHPKHRQEYEGRPHSEEDSSHEMNPHIHASGRAPRKNNESSDSGRSQISEDRRNGAAGGQDVVVVPKQSNSDMHLDLTRLHRPKDREDYSPRGTDRSKRGSHRDRQFSGYKEISNHDGPVVISGRKIDIQDADGDTTYPEMA